MSGTRVPMDDEFYGLAPSAETLLAYTERQELAAKAQEAAPEPPQAPASVHSHKLHGKGRKGRK